MLIPVGSLPFHVRGRRITIVILTVVNRKPLFYANYIDIFNTLVRKCMDPVSI